MPLQKLTLKPGVNRNATRYSSENGWYECDKIRFRQGFPETIGGWSILSLNTYLGVCRSLWQFLGLNGFKYTGVGTNNKFYVELGGAYNDITPIRATAVVATPFAAVNGSNIVTVTHNAHGAIPGDFVTYSGAVGLGGALTAAELNKEYQVVAPITTNTYKIAAAVNATAGDTGNGGATVTVTYQLTSGPATQVAISGWGSGSWGSGSWGGITAGTDILRLWSQANFGEDLLINPRLGGLYYWDTSAGVSSRAVNVTTMVGASDVPTTVLSVAVSDVSRFVLAMGCNPAGSAVLDPLLIRWSDQESVTQWTPASTNQAGFLRLSKGSGIVTSMQSRQEIQVWTDAALYSLQFQGYPSVWGAQLLTDNISIAGPNATALAGGITYWMGVDKFYKNDGHVQTLKCDVERYVFNDINLDQAGQIFGGSSEGFDEVWWFYCSLGSTVVNRYVIYNYTDNLWAYGTMGRTAWLDSGLSNYPIAATYNQNLVYHEFGIDANETGTVQPLNAYLLSSEFDIQDGNSFAFVWRMLPDITFVNSTATAPKVTMTLYPLKNSGSGYTSPASVAGSNYADVTRTVSVPVEQYTGQINVRVRGRQMAMKIESNQIGCAWQLGSPRIDVKPDGRGV
jgi:hypothetical protein